MFLLPQSGYETVNVSVSYSEGVFGYKAGTPMDANGNVTNTNKAFGVLLHDVNFPQTSAQLLVSGFVDLKALEASYGSSLNDGAKNAMSAIRFYDRGTGAFWSNTLGSSTLQSAKNYTDQKIAAARDSIILNSSTEGSTKKFEITVDDSGEISATEITE